MNDPSILRIEDLLSKEELDEMFAFEGWAKRQSPFIYPDAFDKTVNWQNQEIMYRDDDVEAMFRSFCAGKRHDIWLPIKESVAESVLDADNEMVAPVVSACVSMLSPVVDAEFVPPDFEETSQDAGSPDNARNPTRALTDHVAFAAAHDLLVQVNDAPGPGGACHSYEIVLPDGTPFAVEFQYGQIAEAGGVNGVTIEALLAICIDRLRGFQSGQYPCRENALALTKIEEAMLWLHKRTHDSMNRGAEGTSAG